MILLWHGAEPIGICIFASPAASLTLRTRYFQLQNARSRVALAGLNRQLWLLQRVVLHPAYRGAGIASAFLRQACALCPVDWIETLSAMSQVNPVFERAGFQRVGVIQNHRASPRRTYGAYSRGRLSRQSMRKSKHSAPVYYVRDNRDHKTLSDT